MLDSIKKSLQKRVVECTKTMDDNDNEGKKQMDLFFYGSFDNICPDETNYQILKNKPTEVTVEDPYYGKGYPDIPESQKYTKNFFYFMCESNTGICIQICAKPFKNTEFGARKYDNRETLEQSDDEETFRVRKGEAKTAVRPKNSNVGSV